MNRLSRYLIILYSVLIIFFILNYVLSVVYDNYVENYESIPQYDSDGKQLVEQKPVGIPGSIYRIFSYVTFLGIPIFIIFLSALFQFKEVSFKGYFKSLLITGSYALIGIITSIFWLFNFSIGEEGMAIFYIIPSLILTFISSVIINLIVFTIAKRKIKIK